MRSTSMADYSFRIRCTTHRRSRVVAHETYKSLAGIDRNSRGIVQYLFEFCFCEIARRIPAIALEVHSFLGGENDALRLQQLAHPSYLTKRPAPRQFALAIDHALRWHSIGNLVHNPTDHACATRIAKSFPDPAISSDATSRTRLY